MTANRSSEVRCSARRPALDHTIAQVHRSQGIVAYFALARVPTHTQQARDRDRPPRRNLCPRLG